ncbi:MAG: rhodanese-like domain-containing protein [Desulfobulbus sp.]
MKNQFSQGALILDTRDTAAFGGVHIPGSINIGLDKQSANWIGMVLDPGQALILVVTSEDAYREMCAQLHRIGYDNIIGYLYGGITAWQEAGYPITQLWQLSAQQLRDNVEQGHSCIVDVRTDTEWQSGHIQGARHLPITELLKGKQEELSSGEEIIAVCGVGYRGNIAASYLQQQGFVHVHSLAGGMKAWQNRGYPLVTD